MVTVKLYLLLDVVKRVGGVDGEADQDNVGIGVREGAETVVIFLASRIPKGQLDVLAVNLDVGDIVFENGGDVDLERREKGELAREDFGSCCKLSIKVDAKAIGEAWRRALAMLWGGWEKCVVMHTVVGGGRGAMGGRVVIAASQVGVADRGGSKRSGGAYLGESALGKDAESKSQYEIDGNGDEARA